MKICPVCKSECPPSVDFCPKDGAILPADDGRGPGTEMLYDPLIGELIDGRYKIETRLGEGGLATVYAATHQLIEKRVALKVLKPEFVADAEIVERFLREAKAASRLSHVNIISLSDFGKVPGGAPFFVMELLDGRVLSDLLYEGRGLPVDEAVRIITQIGQGLATAHQHGVVHRDLKPDNIGLTRDADGIEHVKILDFGLAKITHDNRKLTRVGQVLGTPEYMSPEQASGQAVDHRSDIFALSILLYRLIVGQVPFAGETFMEVISKVLSESPRPPRSLCDAPELTVALEAVILRGLARAPEDRFPTMDALLDALRSATEQPSEAAAVSAVDSTWMDTGPPVEEPPLLEDQATGPTEAAPLATEEVALENDTVPAPSRRPAEERARRRILLIALVIAVVGVGAGSLLAVLLSGVSGRTSDDGAVTRPHASPQGAPGAQRPAAMGASRLRGAPAAKVVRPRPLRTTVRLNVRSVPTGATVYVNSKPVGTTPLSRELTAGSRDGTVTIVKPGYRPQVRKIIPGQNLAFTILLVRAGSRRTPPQPVAGTMKPRPVRPRDAPRPRPAGALRDLKDPFAVMKP